MLVFVESYILAAFKSNSMKKTVLSLFVLFAAFLQKSTAQTCLTDTDPSHFSAGVSSNVDMSSVPGSVKLVTEFADQQNATMASYDVPVTRSTFGGQTFTPAVNGKLSKLSIKLTCYDCTGSTTDLNVQIRATADGKPTATVLASTTIPAFNSETHTFYDAVFTVPATLTAGTQYAIVVFPSGNFYPGSYLLSRSGNASTGADVYTGGNFLQGNLAGYTWTLPSPGGITTDLGFTTYMTPASPQSGTFTSRVLDAGALVNAGTLSFNTSTSAFSSIRFQVAGSSSPTGPFNFVGPDNTAASYYTTSGATLASFSNQRYFRYKAFLANTDGSSTPFLNEATLCLTTFALPVRWLSISGTRNRQLQPVIDWKVEETNVAVYEVQKSSDGRNYSTVATLPSKGDGVQTYRFTEERPLSATAFYRIRQVDKDNKASYSTVVKLVGAEAGRLQVWPNPAGSNTTLTVDDQHLGKKAELVDAAGRQVQSFRINQKATLLDLSGLPGGIYLLRIEGGASEKISKQ